MNVEALIASLPIRAHRGDLCRKLTDVTSDSRQVTPGTLFVALRGERFDGHDFLTEAWRRGAGALLVDAEFPPDRLPPGATALFVADPRGRLPDLARAFYGSPSKRIELIGITGTNGKTTVAYLLEAIFRAAGIPVALLGTVAYRFGETSLPAPLTTPDILTFHRLLRTFADAGARTVVMEVSSHALAMGRLEGTTFATALFTNLSRDHLDFHGTLDAYFEAKARLFSGTFLEGGEHPSHAIVNLDDPRAGALLGRLPTTVRPITYGLRQGGDVTAHAPHLTLDGFSAHLHSPWGAFPIRGHLIGAHNLSNALAAAAVALCHGISPEAIQGGFAALRCVPGRLEAVRLPGKKIPLVLVDYAHTPDALVNVLAALSPFQRRIVTLFGCGGDRDRGKRPMMAKAAFQGSDFVVVTSDNPRTEDPDQILADIRAGLDAIGAPATPPHQPREKSYTIVPDRKRAIEVAIDAAGPDDIVLIAGKGHEDYQIVGREKRPFDDREVARLTLAQWREKRP
ncbi:MAG: UDP-N-acetylmuramoyl-L-alanyl-D-glutamate--2,6-diaminopimelate ligase [Deltaproteobacteria bacterium]|nr:MAG: UDP-N-acetylmuramoyl-L-alanyl-D-glutamate--2,6-diaminopimelate ligase [Deltaproteobacteria bacterium]